jgi:hypothetical protein
VAGLVASLLTLNPQDLLRPVVISTGLIAIGAWMDADASNLTRPANLYASQALIAFAAIYFVGPLMMTGVVRAMSRGPATSSASRPCSASRRPSAAWPARRIWARCRCGANACIPTSWCRASR